MLAEIHACADDPVAWHAAAARLTDRGSRPAGGTTNHRWRAVTPVVLTSERGVGRVVCAVRAPGQHVSYTDLEAPRAPPVVRAPAHLAATAVESAEVDNSPTQWPAGSRSARRAASAV